MGSTAVGTMLASLAILTASSSPAFAQRLRCPPDSVRVGPNCVDKYEASVWSIPPANVELLRKARLGRVTLQDLQGGGASQLGALVQTACTGNEYGAGFPRTGNWTTPVYALSVAGVLPSSCITWFQAEQACRLADKRLLRNEEWQAAAAGTPDPGVDDDQATTCATTSPAPALTGSRSGCKSNWGAHDMVGNVWEWTSTWMDQGAGCTSYSAEFGDDLSCTGANTVEATPSAAAESRVGRRGSLAQGGGADQGPISKYFPGVITRGGNFSIGLRSGVFTTFVGAVPFTASPGTGFRCGR